MKEIKEIEMKIFFAHSVYDYGSDIEMSWLNHLNKFYPDAEIINSRDISNRIDDQDRKYGLKYIEEKYFFPIIDDCDLVIATSSFIMKRFTIGVIIEMKYAIAKNKKVKIIENDQIVEMSNIENYENVVAFCLQGEEPVRMKDLMKSKGFIFV